MDRGLLSDQAVIAASRDFVCIRTATYEDKLEAEFHREKLFGQGSDLRNFGYCLLSPDAKTSLKRSRRGPNYIYANAAEMAGELQKIAKRYPKKRSKKHAPALPKMKNVRLALNVASCDGLPLVIAVGKNPDDVKSLSSKLSGAIWGENLAGKFIYATTTKELELEAIDGAKFATSILVIAPSEYGLTGKMLTKIGANASVKKVEKALLDIAESFRRTAKSHGSHVRIGRRNGDTWETEVPVPVRRRRR
jgi:hypothetical protein